MAMYLYVSELEKINDFLEKHKDEQFTSTELFRILFEKTHYSHSPAELTQVLKEPGNQQFLYLKSVKIRNRYYYQYDNSKISLTISGYNKIKNFIYFTNKEDVKFYYDFNSCNFNIPLSQIKSIKYTNSEADRLFNLCDKNSLKEWIFSYPELWSEKHSDTYGIDFDCPAGYITFLMANRFTINKASYKLFKLSQLFPSTNLRVLTNWVDFKYATKKNEEYIFSHPFLFSAIQKMYIISAKSFEIIPSYSIIENIITSCRILEAELNNFNILDTNRGLLYNNKLLKEACDKEKDRLLSLSLQRINDINHFQISDYEVIVPQNLADLQNEGNQQNNCVGYYYNNSIIQQENYIYFLRKKENPKQSYMTCRFNVRWKETEEKYYKNNRRVRDKHELKILKQIDEKIRQILSTE